MKRFMLIAGIALLCFAGGIATGYWAVPRLVISLQSTNSQASPPAGSVALSNIDTFASNASADQNTPSQLTFQPITVSGHGQQASKIVSLPAGGYRVTMTHDGQSNFIVILDDSQGKQVEILANQVGKANISQAMNISAGGYLFNVGADGNWTIKIEAL